jgi:SAM-dependent methyltransferase
MADWFEDEDFWEKLYPFLFPEEKFELAGEQAEKLLALISSQGNDVLDLACGPGRHSTALTARGIRVTGVDLSPFLLTKAKERADAAGVEVEWVRDDMRSFVRPDAFDLVINMFTAFGYFDDKNDDLKVLRNVHQSLRAGGVLVMDTLGKERLAKEFLPTTSEQLADGRLLVARHEIFDDWTRIGNEWTLIENGEAITFRFHHTVYSGQELKDRMREAGFGEVTLYGDLDGNEYGTDATRLTAAARK